MLLLVPLVSVIAALFLTRKKASFVISRWEPSYVAAGAECAGDYRAPALVTRFHPLSASHATRSLPYRTLEAASLCRFAFCVASVFAAPVIAYPVLAAWSGDHAGATLYLGWSGLALAAGQFFARRSLLAASPSSPAVATGVGWWTVLHNLVVIGCVLVCSQAGRHLEGDWVGLETGTAGVVFVLYAVCSILLGLLLRSAGIAQRQWLADNGAVSPVVEAAADPT
jgi:hypothetical protein